MKKLNFEQMEKLSAGIEMVSAQSGIKVTEDPLTKNQRCLLLGGIWVGTIGMGATGAGWAAFVGISALAIMNC